MLLPNRWAAFSLFACLLAPAPASVISWSTYLGGSGMDNATALAVDRAGNVYVAGWTDSRNLPVSGAAGPLRRGGTDAFVAKWSPGGALVYCRYLGGSGYDRAYGIAADSFGNAYVTGSTSSADFPVLAPVQARLGGGQDAFVAKLDPAGNLVYSTYLGGNASDSGNAIAWDSAGRAYVVGETGSANFPVWSAFQNTCRGQSDVFVSVLSPAGSQLLYSTYLGGMGDDHGRAIAVDSAGNAYATGDTTSADFPIANAFQRASGGNQDAFVVKLSPNGRQLLYGTYLGGSGGVMGSVESGSGIAVDPAGNAYVTGTTASPDFPLASALQPASAGGMDAFVAKLNPAGNGLVYSTYLGGSSIDFSTAIALDAQGNASVAGYTASLDFPAVQALQSRQGGSYDAFVARFAADGRALLQSTFLGGSQSDSANALALDQAGALYLAGQTLSLDFPLQNPGQRTNAGSLDAFVARLAPSAGSAASFLRLDAATQGTWKGAYGADGSAIANDSAHYPAYARVTLAGHYPYTWAASTADVRALQKYSSADRIASTWASWTSFTIDVDLTGGSPHQVALYCLDWDRFNRSQRIDVLDAVTGALLDTRTISNFVNGQYLVWNLAGHVTFRITTLTGNAVVSGVFFK